MLASSIVALPSLGLWSAMSAVGVATRVGTEVSPEAVKTV